MRGNEIRLHTNQGKTTVQQHKNKQAKKHKTVLDVWDPNDPLDPKGQLERPLL